MSEKVAKNEIPGEKEGAIIQIGIVVRDLEKTMDNYEQLLNLSPWEIYTFSPENGVRDFSWKGEAVDDFEYKLALATLNNIQFELIEPVKNVPVFENFLQKKGEGVHHIKQKVEGENLEEHLARLQKRGAGRLGGGKFDEDVFVYMDTEDPLGVIWELGNNGEIRKPESRYP